MVQEDRVAHQPHGFPLVPLVRAYLGIQLVQFDPQVLCYQQCPSFQPNLEVQVVLVDLALPN